MIKKKILVVFGTRPEAIKMAPIIAELKKQDFNYKVCFTGQHKELVLPILNFFEIKPDYELNIMQPNQTLYTLTSKVLLEIKQVFEEYLPDLVLVHGDTTTAFTVSLAAFYSNIKIGHIEAGLRTGDLTSPFPEEANRNLISKLASYHFAPTKFNYENLLRENINPTNVLITGNTVIDALYYAVNKIANCPEDLLIFDDYLKNNNKLILVTGHRRENFGDGFLNICESLKQIAIQNPEVLIIYPVHLNPNVQEPVNKILGNISNIYLLPPLNYDSFIFLMKNSFLILTDSGGVQEEAPSLGIPVLVMRNNTERQEAIDAGTVKLVGTDVELIVSNVNSLLIDEKKYLDMKNAINPYGDGLASLRIIEFIKSFL